eukprot:312694_1
MSKIGKKRKHEELNNEDETNPPKRARLANENTDPNAKSDIFNGKDPKSYTVKQLKELCRKNNLKVGGNKTKLIERLSNPTNITSKAKGGKRLSVQKVHKMLSEQGIKNPESVSKCLKRGIQKGYVIIDSSEGLNKILLESECICCSKTHIVLIKDILYQSDYAGLDYEDGGEGAEIQCEDCCGLYVTNICEGKPNFDSGKFHNHCKQCPDMGKCIYDYRNTHCYGCGDHYFCGSSGRFGCHNCDKNSNDVDF